jgi:hypothetical protein
MTEERRQYKALQGSARDLLGHGALTAVLEIAVGLQEPGVWVCGSVYQCHASGKAQSGAFRK